MMESIPNLNEARLKIVYPQIADLPYAAQEAVNILRGNLQLSGKGIQAIAVTSAVPSFRLRYFPFCINRTMIASTHTPATPM